MIKKDMRKCVRRDALAAWADYQIAGQHVAATEADAWLADLEAGKDGAPSECHD